MSPIFVKCVLTYREVHALDGILRKYIIGNEEDRCLCCGQDLLLGHPHNDNCSVQVAYDMLHRLDGHPLPHEREMRKL